MTWSSASKRALSCGQWLATSKNRCYQHQTRFNHQNASLGKAESHTQDGTLSRVRDVPTVSHAAGAATVRYMSSPSEARIKKLALDRDVLVSVLEVSATRRDAKGYLQTYTPEQPKSLIKTPKSGKDQAQTKAVPPEDEPAHVAIVKLRAPQHLDQETLEGVAKTVNQLRVLGLLSIVVVDCGPDEPRERFHDQASRLCEAIDSFGRPAAKLIDTILTTVDGTPGSPSPSPPSYISSGMRINDVGFLARCLQQSMIPVIPSLACSDTIGARRPVDSNQAVLALTRFLIGYQFDQAHLNDSKSSPDGELLRPKKIASVERVIILDPLGGTPVTGRPGACHRFINLEQEYDTLARQMMGPEGSPISETDKAPLLAATHAANLGLAKETLSMLPAASSALITTPSAAANMLQGTTSATGRQGFKGMVTTRKRQNPLLHNLLTDKPVYSSSLPVQRKHSEPDDQGAVVNVNSATLVKRGMPLTIYPDPRKTPWRPPKPGSPRLRLTDKCIDLPRLVHLIDDSFNRKLDTEDYLNRVNENLAGVIVAGEYEGGAILTWELPPGLDPEQAYEEGRLVPYLDKFAVLKSRQGSGGVADVVFNAMVRDCFPEGVCWRSRKNNPVNKWYFERSAGTNKLADSNWAMFWTTAGLDGRHPTLADYESVCRGVEPSWADNKHILD
jgi:amino-acid N-acetyltransferase